MDSNSNSATAITENGKISEFFWDADKSPLTQTQTVTVTATSTSIYGAQNPSNANASFDLSFADPCIDTNFVTITQTTQTDPSADSYSGNDVTFVYNPFNIVAPIICLSNVDAVSCQSISPDIGANLPCQELSASGELTWNFPQSSYTNGDVPPGTYTFTYDVSTESSKQPQVTQ